MAHIILPSMHIALDFSGEYTPLVCNQDEIHRDFHLCLQKHCFFTMQSVLFIFMQDPQTQSLDLIPASPKLKDVRIQSYGYLPPPPEYPTLLLMTEINLQVIPSTYHKVLCYKSTLGDHMLLTVNIFPNTSLYKRIPET